MDGRRHPPWAPPSPRAGGAGGHRGIGDPAEDRFDDGLAAAPDGSSGLGPQPEGHALFQERVLVDAPHSAGRTCSSWTQRPVTMNVSVRQVKFPRGTSAGPQGAACAASCSAVAGFARNGWCQFSLLGMVRVRGRVPVCASLRCCHDQGQKLPGIRQPLTDLFRQLEHSGQDERNECPRIRSYRRDRGDGRARGSWQTQGRSGEQQARPTRGAQMCRQLRQPPQLAQMDTEVEQTETVKGSTGLVFPEDVEPGLGTADPGRSQVDALCAAAHSCACRSVAWAMASA